MRYRDVFTLWTALALLALFIHKADLVVPPVQSIVLAVDPFPLAFASANFPHGLSHLRDTHCRISCGHYRLHQYHCWTHAYVCMCTICQEVESVHLLILH